VPQRTHRANHNDSPRPEGENRIVRKCMQELGISREAMADAGIPIPSTIGEAGFGENEFGSVVWSPGQPQVLDRKKDENSLLLLTRALNGESFGLLKTPISKLTAGFRGRAG
jgi:hypothetical protein